MLKEYEDAEYYEECAIIRNALQDYKDKYANKFPKELNFPMHISEYKAKAHQDIMRKLDIVVEDKLAKEKATLIKLNLPIR